jgi:hypothetical protein
MFLAFYCGSKSRTTIRVGRRRYVWLSQRMSDSRISITRDGDCSPGFAGRPVWRATALYGRRLSECAAAEADYGLRLRCRARLTRQLMQSTCLHGRIARSVPTSLFSCEGEQDGRITIRLKITQLGMRVTAPPTCWRGAWYLSGTTSVDLDASTTSMVLSAAIDLPCPCCWLSSTCSPERSCRLRRVSITRSSSFLYKLRHQTTYLSPGFTTYCCVCCS